jgi:hypothetical protein
VTNNYEKPQFSNNLSFKKYIFMIQHVKIEIKFLKLLSKSVNFFPFSLRTAELHTSVTSFDF